MNQEKQVWVPVFHEPVFDKFVVHVPPTVITWLKLAVDGGGVILS
jgi:hypothetical protein